MQHRMWLASWIPRSVALTIGLSFAQAGAAATLSSPVSWGSPDQPWGQRRAVTAADRSAIAAYRSGHKAPIFATNFTSVSELQSDWTTVSDDNAGNQSCRRPGNIESSSAGLRLKTLLANGCRARWSTGYVASKATFGYGFFEARIKIGDIRGLNNAVWLTTDDNFEIDIAEARYPNYIHLGLQYWPPANSGQQHAGMGWGANFKENLASAFHDVGLLRTPTDMVYEVDGEPIAAVVTHGAVRGSATIRLSSALGDWAGGKVPDHPENHDMLIQSLRVFAQ